MGAMTLWSGLGDGIALDWTKAPHVLVAGMTGSGKSVLMTSIINELIDLADELGPGQGRRCVEAVI